MSFAYLTGLKDALRRMGGRGVVLFLLSTSRQNFLLPNLDMPAAASFQTSRVVVYIPSTKKQSLMNQIRGAILKLAFIQILANFCHCSCLTNYSISMSKLCAPASQDSTLKYSR
jgi:hypothetical protein